MLNIQMEVSKEPMYLPEPENKRNPKRTQGHTEAKTTKETETNPPVPLVPLVHVVDLQIADAYFLRLLSLQEMSSPNILLLIIIIGIDFPDPSTSNTNTVGYLISNVLA